MGNMWVLCGIVVGKGWETKLCGLYDDSQLLGCGDYVDFVPIKLPYIVCSAEILVYRAYKILNFCGPWPPMSKWRCPVCFTANSALEKPLIQKWPKP